MSPHPLHQPTPGELEILNVLWQRGPSTVRDVLEHLPRDAGYTTVLKLLQIMHEKGLVHRDDATRTHVYRAALPQQRVRQRLVRDLVDRAFAGAANQLIVQALSAGKLSKEQLQEISEIIRSMEEKQG